MRQIGRVDFAQITGQKTKLRWVSEVVGKCVWTWSREYLRDQFALLELAVYQYDVSILIDLGTAQAGLGGGLLTQLAVGIEHGIMAAFAIGLREVIGFQGPARSSRAEPPEPPEPFMPCGLAGRGLASWGLVLAAQSNSWIGRALDLDRSRASGGNERLEVQDTCP